MTTPLTPGRKPDSEDFADRCRVYAKNPRTGRMRVLVEGVTEEHVKHQLALLSDRERPPVCDIVHERVVTARWVEIIYITKYVDPSPAGPAQPQPPTPDVDPSGEPTNAWPPSQRMPRWTPRKPPIVDDS